MSNLLRLVILTLIVITVLTTGMGMDPFCTLALDAHGDPCQAGHGETLAQHLAHASTTFPDLFIFSQSALFALTALVSTLLARSAFLPARHLRRSPEQPPRFA